MGFLPSPTERTQFVDALKLARLAGWSDVMLAKSLCVSNGDLKNMLTEHKPPSPKHITRLNGLLLSNPPRRIAPPAPSRPVVTPPKFSAATPDKPPEPRAPSSPPEVAAAPSVAPPEGEPQPKENHTMQTTTELNGASHRDKPPVDNSRYHLLPPNEAKALRRALNDALTVKYGNSIADMATALNLTVNGLRKSLTNREGSISEQTRDRFTNVTGWRFTSGGKTPKAAIVVEKRATKKPRAKAAPKPTRTMTRLGRSEAKAFRLELQIACVQAGSVTAVADGMGVNRNTLALILGGKGTTHETLARFRKYKGGGPTVEPSLSLVTAPDPEPRSKKQPIPAGDYDLYEMAGRLLGSGRPEQAHVLSLVARVSELVPIEKVTSALNALVYAATG